MFEGTIVAIFIGSTRKQPLLAQEAAHAVPGKGLEGDRYFRWAGTFSKRHSPSQEVTLIESEAIAALERDYGVILGPGESRRNLVTRGVPLNHLTGREFLVGEVRLRGIKLCEPCSHLERLADKPLVKGLRHRGGLRAQVLTEGTIRVGDRVAEAEPLCPAG